MITDRRIVCLSSLPWEFLPTSRHHLTRVLASNGNEVLFVDPPPNLARPDDVRNDLSRRRRNAGSSLEEVFPNVTRLVPTPRLPYGTPRRFRMASRTNEWLYGRSVRKATEALGWRRPIVWDVCMVHLSQSVPEAVSASAYVLHMTDDLWSYDWYHGGYDLMLQRAAAQSEIGLGSSAEIAERLQGLGFDARELRHGVDVDRFAPVARGDVRAERRLEDRPRPRLGFVGNIEARLDVDLVERVARGEGSVSLVGPIDIDASAVERLGSAGCYFDGAVPYEELPEWLAGFDIALLPYELTPLVRSSRPLKLLEYLAAGLPVVATDITAARELHPHVVTAAGEAEFHSAISNLWANRASVLSTEARMARSEAARPESWHARAEELSSVFAEAEGRRSGEGGRRPL